MRARRGTVLGWAAVGAYVALLVGTALGSIGDNDPGRADDPAPERFTAAWQRSRTATFVTVGVYRRHSEVTGATISSEDVVAQRPPRRLHRQLGGVDGRDDDRLIVCPAPPTGEEDQPEPCRLGPPGGTSYAASVEAATAGVRSLTTGADPLYRVREQEDECFRLALRRPDPRAPFGTRAEFCFDRATGAVRRSQVEHEGGIVEVVSVTSIRTRVTDADLEP